MEQKRKESSLTAEKGGGVISQDGVSNSPSKRKESM